MVAYNVVLVSSVQQTESVIHTHVSTLFQISFRFWSSECIESSSLCHVVGSHLLFALYIVRAGCGTADWSQIRKGVCQDCILSPCLFNFYAEYIMRNAVLEEAHLESRLPGEISITSDMQMTPPLWQKVKRN